MRRDGAKGLCGMMRTGRWLRRVAACMGALALLCALFALTAWAEKPEGVLSVEFSVQPAAMVDPGDATMTFVLTNPTDRPVQNIYLISADGLISEPIGQLGPGEQQTLVRPHAVTEEELDAGEIAYTISHDALSPEGEKVTYSLSAAIARGESQPLASFTRQISSDTVTRGGVVTVTYKIVNTGNVALTALRIRDGLGDFTGRLERLGVGEAKTFISRATLTEAAESAPELEYTVPSGETITRRLDPVPIGIAESALEISFSVGQSVFERDTADAILILTNAGNVDYTGITVVDDVYGGVIADAVSLLSGSAPVEIAHTYPLRGEGEFRWRITGVSSAGEMLDLRTETATLSGAPADRNVDVTLQASARTPRINRPGRVTVDFAIANSGNVMARDAVLYEAALGEIRRLAVVPVGEPSVCSAEFDVAADAQFAFYLNYDDAEGRQHTAASAPVDVVIAPDGVDPARADEPAGTPTGQSVKPRGNSAMFIVLLVIAGAALTVMVTLLMVTSLRARHERLKRLAAEKQRAKADLGKTGAVPVVKAPQRKKKPKKQP